ncbi:hypothetical protein KJ855_04655 [Patescibacteria group bacterium]|nr:hypothetical protein [Patescibacteria group bacterium]
MDYLVSILGIVLGLGLFWAMRRFVEVRKQTGKNILLLLEWFVLLFIIFAGLYWHESSNKIGDGVGVRGFYSNIEQDVFLLINYLLFSMFLVSILWGLYEIIRYFINKKKSLLKKGLVYLLVFPLIAFLAYAVVVTWQSAIYGSRWEEEEEWMCYVPSVNNFRDMSEEKIYKEGLYMKYKDKLPAGVLGKIDTKKG